MILKMKYLENVQILLRNRELCIGNHQYSENLQFVWENQGKYRESEIVI